MWLLYIVFLLAGIYCATVAYQQAAASPPGKPQQAPESRVQEINDSYAKQVLDRIAGHEKEPADKVFKNIRIPWLKTVPAEDFVVL